MSRGATAVSEGTTSMAAPPRADFDGDGADDDVAAGEVDLPVRPCPAPEIDVRRELSGNNGGAQPDGHVVRGEGRRDPTAQPPSSTSDPSA